MTNVRRAFSSVLIVILLAKVAQKSPRQVFCESRTIVSGAARSSHA